MKALSTNAQNATSASRPFDENRDGFVMGEGAGALVLESLEHALDRNAPIIAELAGAACNNDAYHATATHPEGIGAASAMELALEDAGLSPADVDYVNLHATSTKVGDLSEINALRRVFGPGDTPYLSASKSVTGHLLGAAGAIEAIASVKAIETECISPTMHIHSLDPAFPSKEFRLVRDKPMFVPVNVAMSNNFGFGGHNTIVVFCKY
jgi:3-oxoacyl-[acyl-carrier-protein] synthase II